MSETVKQENIMGTLPIKQLLVKMSVPVILSMLVSTLYNVVDSIFVSRLGESALTLFTSVMQLALMLVSAFLLSRTGNVNNVWFAFIITEVTVACISALFLLMINRRTLAYL